MANINYTPGPDNAPFGNLNTNPEASNYALESQFNPDELNLIRKAIKRIIFDAAPAQFNALKLLFMKPQEDVGLDEFEFLEKTFGRSPIEADAIVAAQAAVPGASQTQTIPLTAASMSFVTPDLIVIYEDNSKGVITSIGPGNQIVVESQTNDGLSVIASGDLFATQSTITADGQDFFSNFERLDTVTRFNFIQFFLRAMRWGRIELQKHKNMGTTDFLIKDKEERMRQLRIDMFNTFFNGQRGEFQLQNGFVAKATGGIFPTMQAAGSLSGNPTLAGLKAAFETLAFNSNHKKEGGVRFIYGTDEILNEFSNIYKQPGLRYEPNDMIANLKLNKIELGTMGFVLVPCELFREQSCFPSEWKRRILVLDQETITPMKMRGIPGMELGSTLTRGNNGSREGFQDFWVAAQLGVRFHNPLASFSLDIQ